MQRLSARQARDGVRERRVGQRAGGDDRRRFGDLVHHAAFKRDQRMIFQRIGNARGKKIAINGQRAARRHAAGLRRRKHQPVQRAHFGLQKSRGIGELLRFQ